MFVGSDEKFQQKKTFWEKWEGGKHGKHGDFMVADFMVSNKQNQPKWYFSCGGKEEMSVMSECETDGCFSRERSFRTCFLP